MSDRRLHGLVLAALLSSILALGGCDRGDDGGGVAEDDPRVVSSADLTPYPEGKPERVVLEWWRDVQFKNAPGALRRYHPSVDIAVEELSRQVNAAASQFVGVPTIAFIDGSGDVSTVYMELTPPGSDAPPRNLAMNLRLKGDEWRLSDNLLLQAAVGRVARARADGE
jgi:hypothetical protein